MKKPSLIIVLIVLVLAGLGLWSWQWLPGIWPAFGPGPSIPVTGQSGPLKAPDGWAVSLLTDQVPGARAMALDGFGNLWVSQTSEGTVSLVYLKDLEPGQEPEVGAVLRGLDRPHGLAFDPSNPYALYVAQEEKITKIGTYSDGGPQAVASLPAGGRHFTRSLVFGSDDRLYVSIGSTCDVCREKNPEHGSVISMKKDGTDRKIIATGLRNAVFMASKNGHLLVTEMGRDNLGDDLPPDEVNDIDLGKTGQNFGWPICYGDRIHDSVFDTNVYIRDPCTDTVAPIIEIPAHSAPLGITLIPNTSAWPAGWRGDIVAAYHGSWNRTVPTGYKVVRWHKDASGKYQSEDLVTGFLSGSSAIGRPVGVLATPDGVLYISDDKSGAIWEMKKSAR